MGIGLLRVSAILLTVVRKSGDAAGGEAAEGCEAIGTVEEESLEIVKTQFFSSSDYCV